MLCVRVAHCLVFVGRCGAGPWLCWLSGGWRLRQGGEGLAIVRAISSMPLPIHMRTVWGLERWRMGRTAIGAWPRLLGRLAVSSVRKAWCDAKAPGRCHPRPKSRCSGGASSCVGGALP